MRRSNGRWVALEVERSGGGGNHGGSNDDDRATTAAGAARDDRAPGARLIAPSQRSERG